MHDIICPHCGESFIARDVAFDLSEYIIPLLSGGNTSFDIKDIKFKFLVDEDMILKSPAEGNTVPLLCDDSLGPGATGDYYVYLVNNDQLLKYIADKVNCDTLKEMVDKISSIKNGAYAPEHEQTISAIYNTFFGFSDGSYDEFDMRSRNAKIVISVLEYIRGNPNKSVKIHLRLYCSKMNEERPDYRVGDILFVKGQDSSRGAAIHKCCRSCGAPFPDEFGYFKMRPIVLLGSHFSGKTSFLLSLLYTIRNMPPFVRRGADVQSGINARSLVNDADLVAFDKNVKLFAQNLPPIKTDFADVPILNLLINGIIYSLIDWPGEKFISDRENNMDYAFTERRVIAKASHFLCFFEPAQIVGNMVQSEENVMFDMYDMAERFRVHIQLASKLRSITYIVNKFDVIAGISDDEDTDFAMLVNTAQSMSETDIYMNGQWNESNYKKINKATKNYLYNKIGALLGGVNSAYETKVCISYFPAAPYGQSSEDNSTNNAAIHHTCLSGLPILKILKEDGKIGSKES